MIISRKNKRVGFTLIELLVVIALIGILAAVLLARLNIARERARDAQRVADVKQITTALELYYNTYGMYPRSSSCGAVNPSSSWCNSVQTLSAGGNWIRHIGATDVLNEFLTVEPIDPLRPATANWRPYDGGTYFYYSNDGRWYMIVFGVERYPHALESQDGVTNCAGTTYHYGNNTNGVITIGESCPQ